jgi:hypothetical protein
MNESVTKLYQEICETYFPRWKPWDFTFNHRWSRSGYCNIERKHIYFGDPSSTLIIHEICHAVSAPNHGKKWQARVLKAAEIAKQYDCKLSKELVAEVEGYQNNDINEKEEMESFYNRIAETFNMIYKENSRSNHLKAVNVFHVLKNLLAEMGIRKEWNEKRFEKILRRGRKIAALEWNRHKKVKKHR